MKRWTELFNVCHKYLVRMISVTEQELFKKLLQNLIYETENDQITTTEEIINLIVNEFRQKLFV